MKKLVMQIEQGILNFPKKKALHEAMGFVFMGLALLIGLALLSFDANDYFNGVVTKLKVHNYVGPAGAYIAQDILGFFGIAGLLVPLTAFIIGASWASGYAIQLTGKRMVGWWVATCILAAFCEIHLSHIKISEPMFGYGGTIGKILARPLRRDFGYLGSMIIVTTSLTVVMVMADLLAISKTPELVQLVRYKIIRFFKAFLKRMKSWNAAEQHRLDVLMGRVQVEAPAVEGTTSEPRKRERKKPVEGISAVKDMKAPLKKEPLEEKPIEFDFYYHGRINSRPKLAIFHRSGSTGHMSDVVKKQKAELITSQLREFKVEGRVTAIQEGPVVTTFEFEPAPGTKVAKVTSLSDDLARMLHARSLRILAPIPGKNVLGFEVPNDRATTIGFGNIINAPEFQSPELQLPIALGVDTNGKPVVADLAKMPHLLVAGSTGSGKSVFMNTLIASLLCRHTAQSLRFIMIDPKMVEMAAFNNLPHLACPVVTDPVAGARQALNALVEEMEERYLRMQALGAKNIQSFNQIIQSKKKSDFVDYEGKWSPMPYIVLIVDELADMMMVLGKEAETPITRLAQKARAAGIHLVIATQRPSADVVTGLIKANFPTRVAFRVLSGIDSRTILDAMGAETLLGKGDMLYLSDRGTIRIHGAFLGDEEVATMVNACRN